MKDRPLKYIEELAYLFRREIYLYIYLKKKRFVIKVITLFNA